MIYTFANGTAKQTPISVNGQPLPPPAYDGMTISKNDLHTDAERNAAGVLVTDLIRAKVVKIELQWSYLAAEDFQRLESILGKNMWKPVTFLDTGNIMRSLTMYMGDMKYVPFRMLSTGKIEGYKGISFNLIEK